MRSDVYNEVGGAFALGFAASYGRHALRGLMQQRGRFVDVHKLARQRALDNGAHYALWSLLSNLMETRSRTAGPLQTFACNTGASALLNLRSKSTDATPRDRRHSHRPHSPFSEGVSAALSESLIMSLTTVGIEAGLSLLSSPALATPRLQFYFS